MAGYGRSRLAAAKSSSQAMASVSTWLARLPGQSLFFRRSSVLPWVSRRAVVCQGRRGGRRRQVQQYRRGLGGVPVGTVFAHEFNLIYYPTAGQTRQ
jgi:hypothetical protein